MSIKIAFVVSAPRDLSLTAGQQELNPSQSVPVDDDPPFLKIGRAEGDEIHLSGPLIGDPAHFAAGLSVAWFFPDEELPDEARAVDLSEAKLLISTTPRKKAEPGWRWHYRLESTRPSQSIRYFSAGGFQPPFKAADLTLHLEYLVNYNYDGYVLTGLEYDHRAPTYLELDWALPTLEAEGFLDD